MSTFGEWLQQQRDEHRLTRQEFAERVGCSVAMLRKIEGDERRPSVQIAGLIANALEIPPAEHATFIRVARGELRTDRLARTAGSAQHLSVAASATRPANNLPVVPTPLIGRQRELAELQRLLDDPQCRLLTLVGPGGIGKTRLALEFAAQLQDRFADGVCFVPLAPVDAGRFIVPVMAHAMGFAFASASPVDPKTQLLNFLNGREMLLVLDNVEHLLKEPAIEVFSELLGCGPQVKLLVTSREALNLQGEWVFEVEGLPVPEESHGDWIGQGTSIELFLQRARRAHVGFDATTDDYPGIVRLCRLVDGMPLAIELAAAWVRMLSCEEIANEIERGLDFLSVSARDLPARHRSMRAVFEHSWELLSHEERRMLACLSVFRGGFTREAAARVADASLAMLSALVTKSLLRRPETGRYDLHELIRQYAGSCLEAEPGQAVIARERHYEFYLAMAEAAAPQLKGSGQLETLRRLEQEHDNFRAAISWALAPDPGAKAVRPDSALQLACALRWFWQMRGHFHEGSAWLTKALQACPEGASALVELPELALPDRVRCSGDRRALGRALEGLALLQNAVGNHAAAYALAERSAAICRELGEQQSLADALMIQGEVLRWQGDGAMSHSRMQEALALYEELGDRWNVARSLFRLGQDLSDFGGDPAGCAMLHESSSILEELGDRFLVIGVLGSLGIIAVNQGDYAAARSYFDRALALSREISDPWGMADALTNIGCVLRIQGDYAAARSHLEEALRVYEQWGRGTWCADALCALAENEMDQGNFPAARLHLRKASAASGTSGNRWLQVLVTYFEGVLAYREGEAERALSLLQQAIELARESQYKPDVARSLVTLGRVWRALGKHDEALSSLIEGLQVYLELDSKLGIAGALESLGGLWASGSPEQAVRALSAAKAIRSAIGASVPPVDRPGYEGEVACIREQIGESEFAAAWAQREAESYRVTAAKILESCRFTDQDRL